MNEFPTQILIGMLAGILANFGATYLKNQFAKRRNFSALRLKQGQMEIDLPIATNFESLKRRMDVLTRVSPRLAILDGWQLLELTIIKRAAAIEPIDASKVVDVLTLARRLPDIDSKTLEELERLRMFRNLIAHAVEIPEQSELEAAIADVLPLVSKLEPTFLNAARQPRG
jgi:transcriptional regulator NrdR family protein